MGFLDEMKDKAQEGLATAKDKAQDVIENVQDRLDNDDDTSDEATTEKSAQGVGDFAPVGATEPEVAEVEDETAQASAASGGEATGVSESAAPSADNAAAQSEQGVGDFAPVGATEPEVAAVEDETAQASAASATEATGPVAAEGSSVEGAATAGASEATDSAAASVAETSAATQGSAGSIADAPGRTEPAAAGVPEATEGDSEST
jgi:hypothetical protein